MKAPSHVASSIFTIQSATDCIREALTRPPQNRLLGTLWHDNELCILFADQNIGKSILAVQVGNAIAGGRVVRGLSDTAPSPQRVLYVDFELSDRQFTTRYTDLAGNVYPFHTNFLRAEMNPDTAPDDLSAVITSELEKAVLSYSIRVLIVDNISYCNNQLEKQREALPLVKKLKALKSKHDISILALAHTPKRDMTRPITANDLAGSKSLINFADSSFAIGKEFDGRTRYVKHIKARNAEIELDGSNVALFSIEKKKASLEFVSQGFGDERELLREPSRFASSAEGKERAKSLASSGFSLRSIAAEVGVSHTAVAKWLKESNN